MNHTYSITPSREKGQHLTLSDRFSIQVYDQLCFSLRMIANELNCSPSTILNELHRGTGSRNGNRGRFPQYSAKRGQAVYEANRSRCHQPHKCQDNSPFIEWVVNKVRIDGWSLDMCVGYAKRKMLFPSTLIVSTRTLYNELWAGNLPLTPFDLPEAISRKHKEKGHRKNKSIKGKSIEERPIEADNRSVCGHWEIDTVVGKRSGKESVVLTLVEKKVDYYIAIKIPGKDVASVMTALEVLREEFGAHYFAQIFKTITADNGAEFSRLSELEAWGVGVYFAHPYCSWERAQNERHNRLFRRYLPKGESINKYSAEQILSFADEMNALPRKILGYFTPEELFDEFLDQVYALKDV